MKYIIIGLGDYGFALADELATVGHEVIGVDNKPAHVEPLKDKLAAAFVMDATDEQALAALPFFGACHGLAEASEGRAYLCSCQRRVTSLSNAGFQYREDTVSRS